MIEKIIWQTHNYEYKDIPEHAKKCMLSWKMANPDWEHRYVDHNEREDFIKEKYPELYNFYKIKIPIFQSDIWRIAVVYEFGGVYVDMDSWCRKPLSYMLNNTNYDSLITEPHDRKKSKQLHINNAMFGAPQGCLVLKNMIDEIVTQYLALISNKNYTFDINNINSVDVHNIFSNEALKKYQPFFNAGAHGKLYKSNTANFEFERINYYGNIMSYSNYLKEILNLDNNQIKSFI